jgi:hypothetical protein
MVLTALFHFASLHWEVGSLFACYQHVSFGTPFRRLQWATLAACQGSTGPVQRHVRVTIRQCLRVQHHFVPASCDGPQLVLPSACAASAIKFLLQAAAFIWASVLHMCSAQWAIHDSYWETAPCAFLHAAGTPDWFSGPESEIAMLGNSS